MYAYTVYVIPTLNRIYLGFSKRITLNSNRLRYDIKHVPQRNVWLNTEWSVLQLLFSLVSNKGHNYVLRQYMQSVNIKPNERDAKFQRTLVEIGYSSRVRPTPDTV